MAHSLHPVVSKTTCQPVGQFASSHQNHHRSMNCILIEKRDYIPHLTRRATRVSASGEDGSAPTARENTLNSQLDTLKEDTKLAFAEAIERVQAMALEEHGSDGDPTSTNSTAALQERLRQAIEDLTGGLIERDTEVRLLLLAALSQEHVLYLGPPGTAKSELGRRLSKLCGGAYFERLLTRFSVPEELFGPLSMHALENDEYIRQVQGYLPTADVAFIDEIFKANSAILNTLLTILNERLFDNGATRTRVPLLCLVGASNELPESEELDALYDRFLIRRQVSQVSPAGLMDMLSPNKKGRWQAGSLSHPGMPMSESDVEDQPRPEPMLTTEDFETTRSLAEQHVEVSAEILNIVADLRQYLQEKCEPPVYVSDRRLVKSVALLQVAAYSSGRTYVTPKDCMLLQHVLWQRPEESEKIYEWLLKALTQDEGMQQMQYLLSGMFGRACKSLNNPEQVAKVTEEVSQLRETLEDKLKDIIFKQIGRSSGKENLWTSPDEMDALDTALSPKLDKTKDEVERLLYEVITLEVRLHKNGV
jgi:MoxR-like ATPase